MEGEPVGSRLGEDWCTSAGEFDDQSAGFDGRAIEAKLFLFFPEKNFPDQQKCVIIKGKEKMMKLGIMANDVKCVNYILNKKVLNQGAIVRITPTTNLPDDSPFKWFAAPLDGSWGDDSLAVHGSDVVPV